MELLLLDTDFEPVAIVDSYKSLIWTDRYDSYGDFELYVPATPEAFSIFCIDYYLWSKNSDHVMIIEKLTVDTDAETGNYLTVTGRSLESILDRRIVWGQKVLSGSFQDAIKTLLEESFISPTIEERKVANFTFEASADKKITDLTIDTQFTGDNLYDVIHDLCEENNIGYSIKLNNQNEFVFRLYSGVDRSYEQTENTYVVFSPSFDNMINSNYYVSKAELKNVTLVGGEGEGNSRKTVAVGNASGLDRREIFTDARDVSSDTESGTVSTTDYEEQLKEQGLLTLSENITKTAFESEVDATQLFRYGEDFFIGDIVQVTNEYGVEGAAYVIEFVMSEDENGYSSYPTFQMKEDKESSTS